MTAAARVAGEGGLLGGVAPVIETRRITEVYRDTWEAEA